jgi:hypothetical protein
VFISKLLTFDSKKHKPKRRQKTKYNVYQNKQKQTTKHSKTKKQNKQATSIDKPTYLAKITPFLIHQKKIAGIYPLF